MEIITVLWWINYSLRYLPFYTSNQQRKKPYIVPNSIHTVTRSFIIGVHIVLNLKIFDQKFWVPKMRIIELWGANLEFWCLTWNLNTNFICTHQKYSFTIFRFLMLYKFKGFFSQIWIVYFGLKKWVLRVRTNNMERKPKVTPYIRKWGLQLKKYWIYSC